MHKSSKAQQETTEETEIVGDVKKIKNPKPKGWPKALALSTSKYGENTTKENYFCKVGTFPHGTALLGASWKNYRQGIPLLEIYSRLLSTT